MSWLVQNLLNNKVKIHSSPDLESEEYNDLLLVEKAISELVVKGNISEIDINLINNASDMGFPKPIVEELGKTKYVLTKEYNKICERIAYYLGGYFTDDGYLDYMKRKHKLSKEQVELLRRYMKSEYRHKIMRKQPKNDYK